MFQRACLTFALVFAVAAPLGAQQSRRASVRPFAVTNVKGNVFFRWDSLVEKRTSANFTTKEEQQIREEGIELNTEGYIYHPNLFDWRADLRLGATQERISVNDQDLNTDGRLLGYSMTGFILKEKSISMRIFADQTEDLRDRDFGESLKVKNIREGFEILTKGSFPMSLLVEKIQVDQDGDTRMEEEDTKHLLFRISDLRDPDWHTELTYDHYDTDEQSVFIPITQGGLPVIQDLSEKIDQINVSNYWKFGPGRNKHTLSGRTNYLDRRGYFPNEIFAANQQLILNHTETFSTFYLGTFINNKTDVQTDRTIEGEIGLNKSFYESLDITIRGTGSDEDRGDSTEDIVGVFFEADYRKKTPIGKYTSSLELGREREKETAIGGLTNFQNESVTLNGFAFSPLEQPNIDMDTIVIRPQVGLAYIENIDYRLRQTGALTEVSRIVGSGIADGETVLADYSAQVASKYEFNRDHFNWTHRIDFKKVPVAAYFDYRVRDEQLVSGTDPGNLDDIRSQLYGLELDYEGLLVTLEHETLDQLLSPPWVADRVRASYHRRFSRNVDTLIGAGAEKLRYKQAEKFGLTNEVDGDRLDTVDAEAILTAKIARNILVRLKSSYLETKGRTNEMLFTNGVELEWQYGKLDLTAEARYDRYTQEDTSGSSITLMFLVKREF